MPQGASPCKASPAGLRDLKMITMAENCRGEGYTSEVQQTWDKTMSLEAYNIIQPVFEDSTEESENDTLDNPQFSEEKIQGEKVQQINSVLEIKIPGPHRVMEMAIEEENEEDNSHWQSSFDPSKRNNHIAPTGFPDFENKGTVADDILNHNYGTDSLALQVHQNGDSGPPSTDEILIWHSSSNDSKKPNRIECLGLDTDNANPVPEHDQSTISSKILHNSNAELPSPDRQLDQHATPNDAPAGVPNNQELSVVREGTSGSHSIELSSEVVQGEDRETSPYNKKSDQHSSNNDSPSAREEEMATIFFLNLGGVN